MIVQKLKVRVFSKAATAAFYRCGYRFDGEWQELQVDAATAARLQAEPMLEVQVTKAPESQKKPAALEPKGAGKEQSKESTAMKAAGGGEDAKDGEAQ